VTFAYWFMVVCLLFVAGVAAQGVLIEWRNQDWPALVVCLFVLTGMVIGLSLLGYRGAP